MRIAVFTKNLLNPAYEGARLGADRAAARFGAITTHFVPRVPDSPEEQLVLIAKALAEGTDAIVLVPTHPKLVNPGIERINASGIPLVTFVNRLTAGRTVSFVSSDDYQLALKVAHRMYAHLGGRGRVVLVEGPGDSVTSVPRVKAFRDAALGYAGIQIVASCQGAFLREPAQEAVSRVLESETGIDAILAANDSMALGALDALESAGRSAAVGGINAVPEAIAAIRKGRMIATADFNAMNMASIATECLIRHLRGEWVPSEIMLPVQVVDRDNYQAWDKPFSERECPAWDEVV